MRDHRGCADKLRFRRRFDLGLPGHIAQADYPALHYLRIDAAKMELFANGRINELHCVTSEARDEFLAAKVWWRSNFNYRRA